MRFLSKKNFQFFEKNQIFSKYEVACYNKLFLQIQRGRLSRKNAFKEKNFQFFEKNQIFSKYEVAC
jgi:hypothetical protein